VENKPS